MHDYETAAFYIDSAVSEDLKQPTTKDSPALLFFQIDINNPNQASHGLVTLLHKEIDAAIANYNTRPNAKKLTFPELQTCFLRVALAPDKGYLRTLVTTFISFCLEWQHRSRLIELRTEPGTAEPFYIHLFKGCVLFESLLKANTQKKPKQTMLGGVLTELYEELGFALKPKMNISKFDFPTIIKDIPTDDRSIFTAVEQTGRIRNTTGHNLNWQVALGRQDYDMLAGYVASSCLHAIACLYRSQ